MLDDWNSVDPDQTKILCWLIWVFILFVWVGGFRPSQHYCLPYYSFTGQAQPSKQLTSAYVHYLGLYSLLTCLSD